jgi:uncharacterized protein (DUF1501 family)
VRLCLEHPLHASFFVRKLWSYFIPSAPDAATQAGLEALYVGNGYAIRPVVEAILRHPDLYRGAPLVKPPVVFAAGLMRARSQTVAHMRWAWDAALSGQFLFRPPNVSGWNDQGWLDTSTIRGRWLLTRAVLDTEYLPHEGYSTTETPAEAVDRALEFWGRPTISPRDARRARALRRDRRARRRAADLAARLPARRPPERPASPPRQLPRPPDLLTERSSPMPRPDTTCCTEFTRAGRGLPAIEAGMPTPAGTGLSRRSFLLRSAGLALSAYGAGKLVPGALEEGVAMAAETGPPKVLVSIFLSGGIDALSVLAPVEDSRYQSLRPSLKLAPTERRFAEDGRLAWHPAAGALADLHQAGRVTVMPAMGYSDPNQSHFTSRHFYEVGSLDPQARTGWLGRYLDRVGDPNNAVQGLSLQHDLSPTLATQRVAVAATSVPRDYKFDSPGVWETSTKNALNDALGRLGRLPSSDPVTAQARQAQANAAMLRAQLAGLPAENAAVAYPTGNPVADRLKALAGMLTAGLPVRCVTLDARGGYDTHSDQARSFGPNLKGTADAIAAFQRDLDARGLSDRVLVHLWSEFGRRPEENGSAGTDHGAAGVGFVIGSRASGRMIGEFPGVSTLDRNGNLRSTSDYRALYCSLLEGWFGTAAEGIIPGANGFARYAVVR